jgi:hypothetical protein
VDKFQDACDLPKLTQEDINQLNKSIINNEIEAVIVFQIKRTQDH